MVWHCVVFPIECRNNWILSRFFVSFSGFIGKGDPAGAVSEKALRPIFWEIRPGIKKLPGMQRKVSYNFLDKNTKKVFLYRFAYI